MLVPLLLHNAWPELPGLGKWEAGSREPWDWEGGFLTGKSKNVKGDAVPAGSGYWNTMFWLKV